MGTKNKQNHGKTQSNGPTPKVAAGEPVQDGIPTLTDIIIPGDQLRDAGLDAPKEALAVSLSPSPPDASQDNLADRIDAAIEAALPEATEAVVEILRKRLLGEMGEADEEVMTNTPRSD